MIPVAGRVPARLALSNGVGSAAYGIKDNGFSTFLLLFYNQVLGVPAAYAFARFKFRLGEDIAFTLLSFRFAPPLLVLLPLALYYQDLGLSDSYFGLVWVYQLICLPLILWIVRGYFEDISPDIEHAYRIDGHSWWPEFMAVPATSSTILPNWSIRPLVMSSASPSAVATTSDAPAMMYWSASRAAG